jgi:pimeloyl-ACP methyl ester carboxylesterase
MHKVHSSDGAPIAFDRSGEGPALILVGGALSDRSAGAQLAAFLAPHFTVYTYDRRGRGDSGDTAPYSVAREVEDLDALITEADRSVFVFGHSSGAVLALEAASKLPTKIKKLALYEPPFVVDSSRTPIPEDYVTQLTELVAAGRRSDAVEYFMTKAVDVPAEFVAQMRQDPMWQAMEGLAHTLAYDGAIMGDTISGKPLPAKRWAAAALPTLVMDGGASPAWLGNATQALVDILPNAQRRTLAGQGHGPAHEALTPVLVEFFLTTSLH